ncbi:gem-associated protein 5-like isoform X2 [Aphidius gifuensis]|uniref:gem-associated protein 5-like isoform X2 n=1 Tax=Aphidius gifuensis TaxID=684658 RepID=UPI001CDD5B00|nr:gem-associated protein 5-like isoform X2 [Aphidius gifuensis]
MNELTLPPSPNWYQSTILAAAKDGTIAWGSSSSIIIGKKSSNKKNLDYFIIVDAHTEKVNSLAFSPNYGDDGKYLLVSCGEEYIVRIWNLDTLSAVSSQSFTDTNQKVASVDWSKADPNLICAIFLGKLTATCIACSPHDKQLVAIGTKSGLVFVVNLHGSGLVNWKLRGHDTEVTSLSWCPSPLNYLKDGDKPSKDHLLASAGKDKKIYLWKAGSDGRYETHISLPIKPQNSKQHRTRPGTATGNFIVVSWIEPTYILTSSWYSELLLINLLAMKKSKETASNFVEYLHGSHTRGIFSIGTWINPIVESTSTEPDNWRVKKYVDTLPREVWTFAQDRQIICCLMKNSNCQIIQNIPTQGGYVYCMASCFLDTSRIAFGCGDTSLRLWNLSEPHETTFDITSLWQKIMGRVISVAWHPEKENLLAFGTSEGRIGVFDTSKIQKEPELFRQHHRRSIYSLGWAPKSENESKNKFNLYACGDGELTRWNLEKRDEKPIIIKPKNCTEFSWKSDYSCLAVGYEDGSIEFLNSECEILGKKLYLLKKPIECIVWHPNSTSTDVEFSEFKNYLAVSTNAPVITILDMSNLLASKTKYNQNDESQVEYKVVASLSGHADRIRCLAWSPHSSGQLVSASDDGYAQVWNISSQQIIASFTGHSSGIYSVMWSPLDPNLIITGSADFSLRVWKITDQKVALPPPRPNLRVHKFSKKNISNKNKIEVKVDADKFTNENVSNESNDELLCKNINKTSDKKEKIKKPTPYFLMSKKKQNDQNFVMKQILDHAKKVKNIEAENNLLENDESLSLFGEKKEIEKIIDLEQEYHFIQGHRNLSTEMNIWNGTLKIHILKAAETKKLNDYMVSLAPSLSQKFWQEICEAYANQLIQESNPTKAVAYLLSIHKIHQAIQVFVDVKMYKEAFAIAKCRLDENDPMMKELLSNWTKHAIKSGLFEDCAQIALVSGKLSEAAVFLARRNDPLAQVTAATLAIIDNNENLAISVADQAIVEAILTEKYSQAREIISKFNSLEFRLIQIIAHDELKTKIKEDALVESWIQGATVYTYLENVRNKFEDSSKLTWSYKMLSEKTYAINPANSDATLILLVSHHLALAAAAPNDITTAKHILDALKIIFQDEALHPNKCPKDKLSIKLLVLLDYNLPQSNKSIYYFDKIGGVFKSLRAYLNVALSTWIFDRLKKEPKIEKIYLGLIVEIIKKTLDSVMEEKNVSYQLKTIQLNKLESKLSTDSDPSSIENLNLLRKDIKEFLDERISVPNPMVAFTKVSELDNILVEYDFDECIKKCGKVLNLFSAPNSKSIELT